ncbi:alpha/beta hydrolase [Corynebacterium pacaense]|uniref:alpha/beta hydrolase n=1 Tax=Corynebacterium pacaense TaxID=1816684 RepID=UPI0009BB2373|nr:alpha/beta hydrolase family protein [Corynebacterium pacaense]
MSTSLSRAIALCALTAGFSLGVPQIAHAENSNPIGSVTEGSGNDVLLDFLAGSSQQVGSTGLALDGLLSGAGAVGSSGSGFSGPFLSSEDGYPLPTDPDITTVELRGVTVENAAERRERWKVASPSMKRVVDVQVVRPADTTADAPILYLLDGIGGNMRSSGWVNTGAVGDVFRNENVTVVMPLGAASSMYTDWQQEDPALGTMKWETFITEELGPLLEADASVNFNGKRAIGGLSMGASGAVRIANHHPELFDATIGISGCYSTRDTLGQQTAKLIVASRGGDLNNMWGPVGSPTWNAQDIVRNPDGLRNMAVYLSAANGAAGDVDIEDYADGPFYNMLAGIYLERGAMKCTENLERALTGSGATGVTVDYLDSGMHNWRNYEAQLQPAWEAIRHAVV